MIIKIVFLNLTLNNSAIAYHMTSGAKVNEAITTL